MQELEKCTNGRTSVVIYKSEGKHVPVASGTISKEIKEAVERFRNSTLPAVYIKGFFEKILAKEAETIKTAN